MTTDLTDIGPAITPPAWCLPDAQPIWGTLDAQPAGDWQRRVSDDVWIESRDSIVDCRVMREAPRIVWADSPRGGATLAQTHSHGDAVIRASKILAEGMIEP